MCDKCETVVITTKEQADAWLKHFDRVAKETRKDNFAKEREKPIKGLTCTCCGEWFEGRQWWNQDCGYGLCDDCVGFCGVDPNGGESETYGVPGIHFLIDE